MVILRVKKRTGQSELFNPKKITAAVEKAMLAVEEYDKEAAKKITGIVIDELTSKIDSFINRMPHVEDIQDMVEEVLMHSHFQRTAKAYILYRRSRTHARELRNYFKIKDDLKLSANAIKILEERYLLKNEYGQIIETPTEMFRRVAKAISQIDKKYGRSPSKSEKEFFEAMKNLEFLPNTPTLFNAGTKKGQLAACFVLPIEDDLDNIFETLKQAAKIQQSGGGTGFSFSHLRPRGDLVKSTLGTASGPVSFMKIYDETTEVIKQGGKRRGANMAVLDINHPDIEEFITSKKGSKKLSNFNISVAVDDAFMEAVAKNKEYDLINPRTKKPVASVNAKKTFDLIVQSAWETGDPGIIFLDEVNRKNTMIRFGKIEATNPCGEVPLLPNESCNLGSINLSKVVDEENNHVDWEKLKQLVHLGIHFLDNVIDANEYPTKESEKLAKNNRRIGLGVMGFADMLIKLNLPYDSLKAVSLAEHLMEFITQQAHVKSIELAKQRGAFPHFKQSTLNHKAKMRNCACTTIAPTGTISLIAGCSSGIEPLFAISFVREVLAGKKLFEVDKEFENLAIKKKFYSESLIENITKQGNLSKTSLPSSIKNLFKTSLEISPEIHVKIQAAFQKYTDNAVSKTINLPKNAKQSDIAKAFVLAYRLKCKGITIYRYGSKPSQVLYLGEGKRLTKASTEFSGGTCIGKVCYF